MRLLLIATVMALTGCNQQQASSIPPEPKSVAVAAASTDYGPTIENLQAEINGLRKRVFDLMANATSESAEFDPQAPKSYSPVKAPMGVVLVRLEKIEPYLDGFIVTFMIGNPSSVAYAGVEGEIKWGRQLDLSDLKTFDMQSAKFESTNRFVPGAWTSLKVNIAPAKPEAARRIQIIPNFNKVSMREVG